MAGKLPGGRRQAASPSIDGVRTLAAELLAGRMLDLAGWNRLSTADKEPVPEDDPRYWIPREILEARRVHNPARAVYKVAYWIVYNLREGEVNSIIRGGFSMPTPNHYGLTGLLRYINAFLRFRSLRNGLLLASLTAIEASRPCKRDDTLEKAAESVEDNVVRFGSIIGLIIGVLFLVSMLLYDYIYIIAVTVAMTAVIWYAVKSMSGKVLFLQVDMPWFECSISDEVLRALAKPQRPSLPVFEILDQSRRV